MRGGVVSLVMALLLAACSRSPRSELRPIDWSTDVLAMHAEVDRSLADGDAKGARAALLEMKLRLDHDPRKYHDDWLKAARKDTYYRLARLDLDEKDLAQALRHCQEGLQVGGSDDVFTANLLALRGTIRQELGQKIPAAEDLHRALLINEQLLQQALEP